VDQSDSSIPIGIVFDSGNLAGDPILVSLEIYQAIFTLVTASTMASSFATSRIATARTRQRHHQ
jgi:hypothetical protein